MEVTMQIFREVCQFTEGNWIDEPASSADLDSRIADCGLFNVYRECRGQYIQPPTHTTRNERGEIPSPRIDRILTPKKELLAEVNWTLGVIGIECKASGKKLGPVVSQCLDYSRASFTVGGFDVMLKWVFIWPLKHFVGDVASVMNQHRIGGAWGDSWDKFALRAADAYCFQIDNNSKIHFKSPVCGGKVGSR